MIKLGSIVTWESQAQGSTKVKTGTVVHILRKEAMRSNMDEWHDVCETFHSHMIMFDSVSIPVGAKEAYLVSVATTAKARPKLYKPYPSKLKEVK